MSSKNLTSLKFQTRLLSQNLICFTKFVLAFWLPNSSGEAWQNQFKKGPNWCSDSGAPDTVAST
jgi:hypothetical protein